MAGGARVFGRVLVGRVVAAERDAAFLTGAQMYPARADLHALLADALLWLLDRLDGLDVGAGTGGCHVRSPRRWRSKSRRSRRARRGSECARFSARRRRSPGSA